MSRKGGWPAFPFVEVYTGWNSDREQHETMSDTHPGMSLRDYLAAQALAGYVHMAPFVWTDEATHENCKYIAQRCYVMADAMIAAREQEPQS